MKKAINISVLRISPNGLYLDYIIGCPKDYEFDEFNVIIKLGDKEERYSIGDIIFEEKYNRIEGRLPLDTFSIFGNGVEPAMYKIEITARLKEDDGEVTICNNDEVLSVIAIISDIHHAFDCMKNEIMRTALDQCAPISDELIRKYLIVYAHMQAMLMRNFEEAEIYFKLIQKCFSKCATKPSKTCGCNSPIKREIKSSCNCK